MGNGYKCSIHGWQPEVDDCPFCDLHGLITEYNNLPGRYSSALSQIDGLEKRLSEMQAKLLASEAAGAQMREFVQGPIPIFHLNEWLEARDKLFARPLGTKFLAEREQMVGALKFYADEWNVDGGKTAREALKEAK